MAFIDTYSNLVRSKKPEWKVPNRDDGEFGGLYELAQVLDTHIPQQLHLQELSDTIGPVVQSAILSTPTLSQGVSIQRFSQDLSAALTAEVTPRWSAIWKATKLAALAIKPTPPPLLNWQASPPAGAGSPFPDGTLFLQYFEGVKYNYAGPDQNVFDIMILAEAIQLFLKAEFPKHGITQSFATGYLPL